MSRVRTKTIKKVSRILIKKYYNRMTNDFHNNKRVCDEVAIIGSKPLRNKIAGYITHLMRRIEKGPVRGISTAAQKEERQRRDNYVPEISTIDPSQLTSIKVDSATNDMIYAIGVNIPNLTVFKDENVEAPEGRPTDHLPQQILDLLGGSNEFNSIELAQQWNIDHQKLIGAIKSLQTNKGVLATKSITEQRLELTNEGVQFANEGSPEFLVFEFIGADGAAQADIQKQPFGKIGMSKAKQFKWVSVDKGRVVRQTSEVVDCTRKQLESIRIGGTDVSENEKEELKKRKLISEVNIKGLLVFKGINFEENDLSPEMLINGSWKDKQFKKYNFESLGVAPSAGHLHPLMKVRSEMSQIFFSEGFTEMPTYGYVEASFWNFDALFQPQQHPARDAHDTFFVSDPAITTMFPEEYLERVGTVHSEGGYGSAGYNYVWNIEEAQKNVLRTHTTAVSARQLYQLAQEGFRPSKLYSIDRVFRNETLDDTHLAEFHQVEGVIAEKNISLAHLIGIFTEFFKKLGITNLRFKPTYNPYTAPSMAIFAYHRGMSKWVEIGNSGLFRPEVLCPMGFPADLPVAGFGLSMESSTMVKYGINNIRDLFGSKIDLKVVYNTPICRLDK